MYRRHDRPRPEYFGVLGLITDALGSFAQTKVTCPGVDHNPALLLAPLLPEEVADVVHVQISLAFRMATSPRTS